MELCSLLAPCVAKLLAQREPRPLEEATRALRWLLIEPEDPALPVPSAGTSSLPSKVRFNIKDRFKKKILLKTHNSDFSSKARDLFLRTDGLVDAVVNAFSFVVTPPFDSRLETVKEVLSLIVCLCKVGMFQKLIHPLLNFN